MITGNCQRLQFREMQLAHATNETERKAAGRFDFTRESVRAHKQTVVGIWPFANNAHNICTKGKQQIPAAVVLPNEHSISEVCEMSQSTFSKIGGVGLQFGGVKPKSCHDLGLSCCWHTVRLYFHICWCYSNCCFHKSLPADRSVVSAFRLIK